MQRVDGGIASFCLEMYCYGKRVASQATVHMSLVEQHTTTADWVHGRKLLNYLNIVQHQQRRKRKS